MPICTIQVLNYLNGLPNETWREPNPEDPLSLVDKVTNRISIQQVKFEKVIRALNVVYNLCALFMHSKAFLLTQVEVALAYKCENNLTRRDLLQYVHRNRDNNARRINTMGETFDIMFIAQRLGLDSVHTLKNVNILA